MYIYIYCMTKSNNRSLQRYKINARIHCTVKIRSIKLLQPLFESGYHTAVILRHIYIPNPNRFTTLSLSISTHNSIDMEVMKCAKYIFHSSENRHYVSWLPSQTLGSKSVKGNTHTHSHSHTRTYTHTHTHTKRRDVHKNTDTQALTHVTITTWYVVRPY